MFCSQLSLVGLIVWVAAAFAPSALASEYSLIFPDQPNGGWGVDPNVSAPATESSSLRIEVTSPKNEPPELLVSASFPSPLGLLRQVTDDSEAWGKGATAWAEILVSEEGGSWPSAQLVAFHPVWGWFSTEPTRQLRPGRWTEVGWNLSADNGDWVSLESRLAWNDTLRRGLEQVGLRVYSDQGKPAQVRIRRFRIEGADEPAPPLETRFLRLTPETPQRGRRVELTFDLSRAYDNPFDPDEIRIDALFTEPSGLTRTVPGFYYQGFERRRLPDLTEQCEAVGRARWKVRFTPTTSGHHTAVLMLRDASGDTFETQIKFDVEDAPFHGFLQIDQDDPTYLSFTSGEFYLPLGLIVRSPADDRRQYDYEFEDRAAQGTYAYDTYFQGMADAGINFSRVWMAAWWTALEWSHGYRRDYPGLGRYNQLNAWRMDYVLDLAEELGIYVDITLHNHGQFRGSNFDSEWYDNAYYSGQGGVVDRAEEFWTDPVARSYVRKRLRYLAARWGSSPAVAWWEMCNEVDLVSEYESTRIRDWHREMARYLKEVDPWTHIVTTHYTSGRFDLSVMGLPEMEIAQSTAYRSDMIERCVEMYTDHAIFGKPVFVNEFGVGQSHAELQSNLHAGLWASSVMPFCGPALFWWWPYVHEKNEYPQFSAIRRFHEGEDYRGRDYHLTQVWLPREAGRDDKTLEAIGMQNTVSARIWLYDPLLYRLDTPGAFASSEERTVPPEPVVLDGLQPGEYTVEFWDTWEGKPIHDQTLRIRHKGGGFRFQAPKFERDLAVKIERE
ncbi:DUF5060 domain-containing protein [bacterium]|nr:DUF5060 domain-containing protein [bacterium]